MQKTFSMVFDIGIAVCPVMGYVSQYRLIQSTNSVGSFSIDICGILLFANILRVNFFIFQKYEIALLMQSILMICMQVVLVKECSKYPQAAKDEAQVGTSEEIQPALQDYVQSHISTQTFWRWQGFQKYGVTILFFAFCSFLLSTIIYFTSVAQPYGQFIGLLALTSESVLSLPQIIKNLQKKSTKGLSLMLVTLNILGDVGKLLYFLVKQQPFQFILCGVIQVILDLTVIFQIVYYGLKDKQKVQKNEQLSPIKSGELRSSKENQIQIETQQNFANKNYVNQQYHNHKDLNPLQYFNKIKNDLTNKQQTHSKSQKNPKYQPEQYSKFQDEDDNNNQLTENSPDDDQSDIKQQIKSYLDGQKSENSVQKSPQKRQKLQRSLQKSVPALKIKSSNSAKTTKSDQKKKEQQIADQQAQNEKN